MFKHKIESYLKKIVGELGYKSTDIVLSIPENNKFGDYSWNGPLQLAKQEEIKSNHSSLEIANQILSKFGHPDYIDRVEVAGPGFINFYIKDQVLVKLLISEEPEEEDNVIPLKYLIEYAHPNTHKAFHIGHLRNVTTGESLSRILEYSGLEVFRVTYGGDIGPHVAKAIWGVLKLNEEYLKVKVKSLREKAEFLGKAYALGSQNYEEDEEIKKEIDQINQKLYSQDSQLKQLWEETKKWSIAYFDTIYSRVHTLFDAQIWESEIQELGTLLVKENLGRIFIEDQGAIIFPGEKYNLHNRVFITSAGYPTYEGKELGLTRKEQEMFPYDFSLHVVANEQESFFEVTTKAIEMVEPSLMGKKKHLSYGMVNLTTGKMSSRKGGVITADSLIDQVKESIKTNYSSGKSLPATDLDDIAIAAIKFFFLKYSLSSDITFDIEKSVSLQGDSGPYLLYAYARIKSILNRANDFEPKKTEAEEAEGTIAQQSVNTDSPTHRLTGSTGLEAEERELLRQIEYFEPIAESAAENFKPNELANYLLNLAKAFNSFYEKHQILASDKSEFRLLLIKKVAEHLKLGLYLLGIETVERM